MQGLKVFLFVLFATVFESVGDAVVRLALSSSVIPTRLGLLVVGFGLLSLYGTALNLAPVEFATVVGLYITLLFVMFQVVNYLMFKAVPTLPVVIGGAFIITGGLIITFFNTATHVAE